MPTVELFPLENIDRSILKKNDQLLRVFEEIHNYIYANDGLSAQQAFDQILNILFVKIFDEKNKSLRFFITDEEYKQLVHDGKILNSSFVKRFNDLKDSAVDFFSELLNTDDIKLKLPTLAYVVKRLQSINLSDSSRDVKGVAFQKFIHSKQRGDRGQFFTPEQVVNLCVEFLRPTKDETIFDPACGSAGFLSQAMKYVFATSLNEGGKKERRSYTENNVYGIEISQSVAKMAKMRMILDGDGFSNIGVADTLSPLESLEMNLSKSLSKKISLENFFDVILTNPPFGTQGKVISRDVLANYDLGFKWEKIGDKYVKTNQILNGQVPDLLFLERCLKMLKEGGRMGIVLPNGDLENSSLEYVRDYISSQADVLAVVSLPNETFIPFGTGVKASILFLKKRKDKNLKNKETFFGRIEKIGYRGNKNGSVNYQKDEKGQLRIDEKGELLVDEDVTELIAAYNQFSKGKLVSSVGSFSMPTNQLSSRLDVNYYSPIYRDLERYLSSKKAVRLGDVVNIVKRKAVFGEGDIVRYVELSDISAGYCEINTASTMYGFELPSRATYLLKKGDIVTSVAGNSIGTSEHATALVTKDYEGAICTNGLRILHPKRELNPYFLLSYLRHPYFLQQVYRFRTGAAIPSISDEDLLRTLIYLPSLKEQKDIEHKMKESFSLRDASRRIMQNIFNLEEQKV